MQNVHNKKNQQRPQISIVCFKNYAVIKINATWIVHLLSFVARYFGVIEELPLRGNSSITPR